MARSLYAGRPDLGPDLRACTTARCAAHARGRARGSSVRSARRDSIGADRRRTYDPDLGVDLSSDLDDDEAIPYFVWDEPVEPGRDANVPGGCTVDEPRHFLADLQARLERLALPEGSSIRAARSARPVPRAGAAGS